MVVACPGMDPSVHPVGPVDSGHRGAVVDQLRRGAVRYARIASGSLLSDAQTIRCTLLRDRGGSTVGAGTVEPCYSLIFGEERCG